MKHSVEEHAVAKVFVSAIRDMEIHPSKSKNCRIFVSPDFMNLVLDCLPELSEVDQFVSIGRPHRSGELSVGSRGEFNGVPFICIDGVMEFYIGINVIDALLEDD